MSAKVLISLRGSKFFVAQSSQNGQPVSGEKCHWTISRRWASRVCCAALITAWSTDIGEFTIYELRITICNFTLFFPARLVGVHFRPVAARRVARGVVNR